MFGLVNFSRRVSALHLRHSGASSCLVATLPCARVTRTTRGHLSFRPRRHFLRSSDLNGSRPTLRSSRQPLSRSASHHLTFQRFPPPDPTPCTLAHCPTPSQPLPQPYSLCCPAPILLSLHVSLATRGTLRLSFPGALVARAAGYPLVRSGISLVFCCSFPLSCRDYSPSLAPCLSLDPLTCLPRRCCSLVLRLVLSAAHGKPSFLGSLRGVLQSAVAPLLLSPLSPISLRSVFHFLALVTHTMVVVPPRCSARADRSVGFCCCRPRSTSQFPVHLVSPLPTPYYCVWFTWQVIFLVAGLSPWPGLPRTGLLGPPSQAFGQLPSLPPAPSPAAQCSTSNLRHSNTPLPHWTCNPVHFFIHSTIIGQCRSLFAFSILGVILFSLHLPH